MYGITVDYRTSPLDWNKIETPVAWNSFCKGRNNFCSIHCTGRVELYAETLDVTMYDANGKAVNKQSITAEGESE